MVGGEPRAYGLLNMTPGKAYPPVTSIRRQPLAPSG